MNKQISFENNKPIQAANDVILKTKQSVCIMGGAGTGKSTLIRGLQNIIPKHQALYTAPTGVAAKNIEGSTLNSMFLIPHICYPNERLKSIEISPQKYNEISCANRIIVDEISMISSGLMECIDMVLRKCGDKNRPFGGKQMIFLGDPFQLPPVIREKEDRERVKELYGGIYFFHSPAFRQLNPLRIVLTEIYRQQNTLDIDCLNNIRLGHNIHETLAIINSICVK